MIVFFTKSYILVEIKDSEEAPSSNVIHSACIYRMVYLYNNIVYRYLHVSYFASNTRIFFVCRYSKVSFDRNQSEGSMSCTVPHKILIFVKLVLGIIMPHGSLEKYEFHVG